MDQETWPQEDWTQWSFFTPPPHKPKELPQLVDTSSQVSFLDDAKMVEASLEGVHTTISPIATTTKLLDLGASLPPQMTAELWENVNKALEELLDTKASIDGCRHGEPAGSYVWNFAWEWVCNGRVYQRSQSHLLPCYPGCSGPMLYNCQGSKGCLHPHHQRSQDHPCTCTIWEAEATCSVAIRDAETWGASQTRITPKATW